MANDDYLDPNVVPQTDNDIALNQTMLSLVEAAQRVMDAQYEKEDTRLKKDLETEQRIQALKHEVEEEEATAQRLEVSQRELQKDSPQAHSPKTESWNEKLDRMAANNRDASSSSVTLSKTKEPEAVKPEEVAKVVEGPALYDTISKKERNLILLALCTGQFLGALDMTIVVIALSDIVTELGEPEYLSWVLSGYMLTSAATTALAGRFSDLYGRRTVYMLMLFMFLLGSCLCGAATNIWFLIIARAIQGIGGGGVMGLTNVIIADIVPPKERARIVGMVSGSFGIATMSGPVIGGLIVTYISWRWVFYVNLPVIAIAFALIYFFTKKLVPSGKKLSLDILGAVLIVGCSSCFLLFVTWGGAADGYPWDSLTIILLIVATFLLLVLFTLQELRHPLPILQLRLLKERNVALCMGLMFFGYGTMMGIIAYIPIYYQEAIHDTAVIAGLKTMPRTVGFVLMAVGTGRVMKKIQLRVILSAGCLLALCSSAAFTILAVDTEYWITAVLFVIQGMGMGTIIPAATVTVQNSAKPQDVASAMSGFSFLGIVGGSLCVAIYGAGFQSVLVDQLMSRHSKEVAVAAGVARVCLIGVIPAGLAVVCALCVGKVELHEKPPPGKNDEPEAMVEVGL